MKLVATLFLFSVGLLASESYEQYSCESNRFFKSSIIVKTNFEDELFLKSYSINDDCFLIFDSASHRFIPDRFGSECTLRNWSRPDTDRDIKFISVNKGFELAKGGYLKISLDNSMAEYGPRELKSFIYCRKK